MGEKKNSIQQWASKWEGGMRWRKSMIERDIESERAYLSVKKE
jgi:hypothetical protein